MQRRASMLRDREGGIAVLMACSAAVLLGFCALAVDVGAVFLKSRQLQGIADLAAIAAARDLDNAQAAAQATADANLAGLTAVVTTGSYSADPSIPSGQRFVPGPNNATAVKVRIMGQADLFFAQALLGKPSFAISRYATAARAQLAAFSIGTRLASLQGGLANQVLSGLAGSTVSLSVMDYNALLSSDVDLLSYSDALRTTAQLQGASFEQALNAQIGTGSALSTLADQLDLSGSGQAATAVRKLATAAGNSRSVQLGQLIDLGPYDNQDHISGGSGATVKAGALALSQAVLTLSQGGRQVKLDLGATVPGLADVDVYLAIGQRPANSPWITVASDGTAVVRTAQTRLYADAKALSALSGLGVQPVRLPVFIEAASGEARISSIDCPTTTANQGVTLNVKPSLGEAAIADLDTTKLNDFSAAMSLSPAKIVDLNLAKVTGMADVKLGGMSATPVRFSRADIDGGTIKTVSTTDLVQATAVSLVSGLNLNVSVLGLGLGLGAPAISNSTASTLGTIAAPLDGVLNAVEDMAGLHIGQADVRVNGLRCREAALVA